MKDIEKSDDPSDLRRPDCPGCDDTLGGASHDRHRCRHRKRAR